MDAFSARVESAQARWLRCGRGCDSCCHTRRSAWAVEIDAIHRYVAGLPLDTQTELRGRLDAEAVVAGERCVFLDPDGACAIYPARPVLCRTHGPAVRIEGDLVWCALNFEGLDPADLLNDDDILDGDRLNLMLLLVNRQFVADNPGVLERDSLEAALS